MSLCIAYDGAQLGHHSLVGYMNLLFFLWHKRNYLPTNIPIRVLRSGSSMLGEHNTIYTQTRVLSGSFPSERKVLLINLCGEGRGGVYMYVGEKLLQ